MNGIPGPRAEGESPSTSAQRLQEDVAEKMKAVAVSVKQHLEVVMRNMGPGSRIPAAMAASVLALLVVRRTGRKGMRLITAAVATAMPAYSSYKALATREDGECRKWLMYWICFALFRNLEAWFDDMLSLIPNYTGAKLSFLVWLQRNGSTLLYALFVNPFLNCNQQSIDTTIARVQEELNKIMDEWKALRARVERTMRSIVEQERIRGVAA